MINMSIKKIITITIFMILFIPFIVNAESKYLYDVLKDEAESGGLAREYTGSHRDSFTEEPSQKIYHWYATNNTQGNQVLEKNNVIFANHCWQMIRTTDTGGVKLIYNGELEDGKCLNTRSPHVGYNGNVSKDLSNYYYYGTDYSFDKSTGLFSLSGIVEDKVWNDTTYKELIGKYTCLSTELNATCEKLYLVESYINSSWAYVIELNSISAYYQFGKTSFNLKNNQLFGYMYNKENPFNRIIKNISTSPVLTNPSSAMLYNLWYGDSVNYLSNRKYRLVSPFMINGTSEYPSLVGKYTLLSSKQTDEKSPAYYISGVDSMKIYAIELSKGKILADLNDLYMYGDSISYNADGTYTINDYRVLERKDWYLNHDVLLNKYVCKNTLNNKCTWLEYVLETTDTKITSTQASNYTYKQGKTFIYENGLYKLTGETKYGVALENTYYTCFNDSGECETLSYIYETGYSNGLAQYYINLTDGRTIEDLLDESLISDDVNKNDSTIKLATDKWYEKYLLNYTDYLDDTIFCSDRSIENKGGWDPKKEPTDDKLIFNGSSSTTDLSCTNITDKFSINNSKAKLKYKVGLLSSSEVNILNNDIIKTNENYWLGTLSNFRNNSIFTKIVNNNGEIVDGTVVNSYGLRPAISLNSSTRVISGNGSTEEPYVLSFDSIYSINVEINNETEDLTIELDDLSQVQEGEEVNFNVTPIKGYKVNSIKVVDENNNEIEYNTNDNINYTFIMPASNVTITPSYKRVSNSVNVDDNKNTKEFIIEVNDSKAVVYEDTVKFTIIPEDGYEIDNIEIIDKNNNKIEYKKTDKDNEYSFTMPETDVIIKPIYRKLPIKENNNLINPLTNNKFIIILLLILLFFSIGSFQYRKQV